MKCTVFRTNYNYNYAFDSSGELLAYDDGDVDLYWMQDNQDIRSVKFSKNENLVINNNAFNKCQLSGGISIPKNVKRVGSGAFYFCKNLNGGLNLEEGIEIIDNYSFGQCKDFSGTLKIPSTVTYVGGFAFEKTDFSRIEIKANNAPNIVTFAFLDMNNVQDGKIHVPAGAVGYNPSYDGLTVEYDL